MTIPFDGAGQLFIALICDAAQSRGRAYPGRIVEDGHELLCM